MSNEYSMMFSELEELLSNPFALAVAGVGLVVVLLALALAVVMYVFQSLSLYTMAKSRGIRHPGLAWVPVACTWILGSLSDQYQYVVRGKNRRFRGVLLGLAIAAFVLNGAGSLFFVGFSGILDAFQGDGGALAWLLGRAGGATVAGLVSAAVAVFQYICLYDVFQSCDPSHSVVFLVLSVIFPVTAPFFLFAGRRKELGMPPRKQPQPEEPQSGDPQKEPWEQPDKHNPADL